MDLQSISVGFLGGGQLARMMILRCHALGLTPWVYCESPNDPAAQVCPQQVIGKLENSPQLAAFMDQVDLVTFESEFVPRSVLKQWIGNSALNGKIFPPASCMLVLQNRESQKSLLREYKIPTAEYASVNSSADLENVWQEWKKPFVIKKNLGGYDGNGTYFIENLSDINSFTKTQTWNAEGYIAERKISFRRELACMFFRSRGGKFTSFPLVETKQSSGRCDWVMGPVKHRKFTDIEKKFKTMLSKINYIGALGVEMFDTGNELLINELAPRVHNSGHYSQLAIEEDQFLLHIKSGLGLSFAKLKLLDKAFVMTNLVGKSDSPIQFTSPISGQINLYGKNTNRPGRKMGHINYIGNSAKGLLKQALNERKKVKL